MKTNGTKRLIHWFTAGALILVAMTLSACSVVRMGFNHGRRDVRYDKPHTRVVRRVEKPDRREIVTKKTVSRPQARPAPRDKKPDKPNVVTKKTVSKKTVSRPQARPAPRDKSVQAKDRPSASRDGGKRTAQPPRVAKKR